MNLRNALLSAAGLAMMAGCTTVEPVGGRVAVVGHGRHVSEAISIRLAPPPPQREVVVAAPGPRDRYVWDPGHYRWDGARYIWMPGQWIARPRPQAEWVAGHWVQRRGDWVWIEGHWR